MTSSFWYGVAILAGVSVGAFVIQLVWAFLVEKKVWKKLADKRNYGKGNTGWGPKSEGAESFQIGGDRTLQAFEWHIESLEAIQSTRQPDDGRGESEDVHLPPPEAIQSTRQPDDGRGEGEDVYWEKQAREVRRSFLARTQGTAERWRNIFAGLLAVFGAVLVAGKPSGALAQLESPGRQVIFFAITATIALSVNAVVHTGWSAAGMPKMLVDVTGPTLFYNQTRYAARSLARLRVGLICGALAAATLSVAAVAVLSTGVIG